MCRTRIALSYVVVSIMQSLRLVRLRRNQLHFLRRMIIFPERRKCVSGSRLLEKHLHGRWVECIRNTLVGASVVRAAPRSVELVSSLPDVEFARAMMWDLSCVGRIVRPTTRHHIIMLPAASFAHLTSTECERLSCDLGYGVDSACVPDMQPESSA